MPAAPAAPPSAAPSAPAPAAAPAAAPSTPTPSTSSPSSSPGGGEGGTGDAFAAMDARILSRRQSAQKPAAEPAAKPTGQEPAAGTPPPEKPQTPPAAQPAKGGEPKALRDQLQRVTKDATDRAARITELETKIADYEKRGADTTKLTEQLATREKELKDLQAQIRMLRREKSPEFVAKFEKPFNDAAEYAKGEVEQLLVQAQADANGNLVEPERQATWDDFTRLFHMKLGQATQAAHKMFGPAAQIVINHLTELSRLRHQRNQALESEMKGYEATERAQVEQANREREFIQSTWTQVNQDIAQRNPDWYGESKDPEDQKLFTEALSLIDNGLQGTLTPQQKIVHDANVRLRAAAAPRLAYRLEKAHARIAELEANLAEAMGSKPGNTRKATTAGAAGGSEGGGKNWKQDLRDTMTSGAS